MNSLLLPLFISYRSSGEKLTKYQANLSCVIIFFILMITLFYKALIHVSQGEIWYWSILRWCYTGRFARTISSATQRYNIVVTNCFKWLQYCSNIWALCYAKNRRCLSSRVTSPLGLKGLNQLSMSAYQTKPSSHVIRKDKTIFGVTTSLRRFWSGVNPFILCRP